MHRSHAQLYNLLTTAECYIATVNTIDKNKVNLARTQGVLRPAPASNIGKVAQDLGMSAWLDENPPTDPTEPLPDPRFGIAPRTYNWAQSNNSDPLFCKNSPGVVVNPDGSFADKFSRYDPNGKDIDGGRTRKLMVAGLNASDSTDGRDPCTLYNGLTKWPDDSYLR